jgi:hypothetical protein
MYKKLYGLDFCFRSWCLEMDIEQVTSLNWRVSCRSKFFSSVGTSDFVHSSDAAS